MTTNDDLDALTDEACGLAMAGVADDDPRRVNLRRRTLDSWIDAEVVRLCDAGLHVYYLGKEPYPPGPERVSSTRK
jgi:hypothetical protein